MMIRRNLSKPENYAHCISWETRLSIIYGNDVLAFEHKRSSSSNCGLGMSPASPRAKMTAVICESFSWSNRAINSTSGRPSRVIPGAPARAESCASDVQRKGSFCAAVAFLKAS